MLDYYRSNKAKKPHKQAFVAGFPYHQYLQKVEFTDFSTLQKDREFVYRLYGEGDVFLYYLGDHFNRYYPVGKEDLKNKLQIGELFLADKSKTGINPRENEVYKIMGYFLLAKVARKLEAEIKSKRMKASSPETERLIQRLAQNKVYVSVEKGSLTKIVDHLKKGNYDYIIKRVWQSLSGKLGANLAHVTLVILVFSFFIFWFRKVRLMAIVLILGILVVDISRVFIFPPRTKHINTQGFSAPSYRLSSRQRIYPVSHKEFAVLVFNIENEHGEFVGESIWMHRAYVKANYFAYQNVPQKYANYKRKQKVVLAATGGFTNDKKQPEGLTVERGSIVNAVLMPDRDGIVIVQRNGGIRVINLKRKRIQLPVGKGRPLEIQNPLHSLIAYSQLLSWCKTQRATLFQTQLLAYGNKLLIDPGKAPSQFRERRLLAGVRDLSNGNLHHVVFNVKAQHGLADLSQEVFNMLGRRNKKVEFLLNLDVGSYNIMQLHDQRGRMLHDVKGPVDVNKATNLIVWNR